MDLSEIKGVLLLDFRGQFSLKSCFSLTLSLSSMFPDLDHVSSEISHLFISARRRGFYSRFQTFFFFLKKLIRFQKKKKSHTSGLISIFVASIHLNANSPSVYNAINTCDVSTDYGKSFSICVRVHKGGGSETTGPMKGGAPSS